MPPIETRKPIKSLRTYQGDVEEAMSKNKTSATTILVAEQKKREKTPVPLEPVNNESTRNKFFIILGLILFILGIGIIYGVYYARSNETVIVKEKNKTLVTYAQEDDIPFASSTRSQIVAAIVEKKNLFKLPVNSILYINLTDTNKVPVNIYDFLIKVTPNMLPSLQRSFDNKYMLGVYSFDSNEPFIILKTNDYASSYSGMLKWESSMKEDLGRIFDVTQDNTYTNTFVDEALKNKDLRVLKGSDGNTQLLYSFIDKNTLIITKNEDIFSAVIGKYQISQQTK